MLYKVKVLFSSFLSFKTVPKTVKKPFQSIQNHIIFAKTHKKIQFSCYNGKQRNRKDFITHNKCNYRQQDTKKQISEDCRLFHQTFCLHKNERAATNIKSKHIHVASHFPFQFFALKKTDFLYIGKRILNFCFFFNFFVHILIFCSFLPTIQTEAKAKPTTKSKHFSKEKHYSYTFGYQRMEEKKTHLTSLDFLLFASKYDFLCLFSCVHIIKCFFSLSISLFFFVFLSFLL